MSNPIFEAYVKSGMFTLVLSKSMVGLLTYLVHRRLNPKLLNTPADTMTYMALERRGLIRRNYPGWCVTGAGMAVYDVLGECDMIDYDTYWLETQAEG